MASAAYTAAGTQSDYYTTWFISTAYVSTVQKIYNDVANVRTTSPKISCTDTYSDCTDGSALLYTVPSANVVCSLLSYPSVSPISCPAMSGGRNFIQKQSLTVKLRYRSSRAPTTASGTSPRSLPLAPTMTTTWLVASCTR